MLSSSSGNLRPDINLLHEMVNECHVKGFPVAIHAVSEEEIDLALLAFSRSHIVGDRIEHASETRDDQIEKIASIGLWLSTQPGFIYQRGDGYISRLKKSYLSRLYRIRSFIEKGIKVGGSSVCSEDSLLETEVVATLRNNELVFVGDRDLFRSFYQ